MVQLLLDNPASHSEARQIMADFMATLPDMDGQARTVATGVCLPAVKQCFDAWVERNGSGKHEDRRILENAIDFMQQFASSSRFVEYPTEPAPRTPTDLAGYRKLSENDEHDSFYILPVVFQAEICKDYDKGKVCQVLHAANWLKYNEAGKRWQHQLRARGLLGALPQHEKEE